VPTVSATSALGAATLALIAHERTGSAVEMHPVLEQAFQYRQLERAKVVLDAIPDGWTKVGGEWVPLEPAKITEWRVVNEANGGISYSTNSRDEGRWGVTKAHEWAERMRGYGASYHIEVWEQTWGSTPSAWRQVEIAKLEGRPS
jgi:hypothetical protein